MIQKFAAVVALVAVSIVTLVPHQSSHAQTAQPPAPAAPAPGTPEAAPAAPPAQASVPAAAPLPSTLPPDVLEPVERLAKNIETAEKSIQQLKELESELSQLRTEVERILSDSTETADSLRPQLEEVNKQIERLGPPPGKDQPPESATVAAERQRLNAMKVSLDGAIKTTELAWVRARQLIERITIIRYQLFTRNLLERRESPLLPSVWQNVAKQIPAVQSRLAYYGSDWMTWASRVSHWLWALAAAVIATFLVLSILIRGFVSRRLARPEPPPTFLQRTIKAAWVAPARMIAPAFAVLMAYFGLAGLDLLFSPWIGLATAMLGGLLVFIVSDALMRSILAPRQPAWRLVPVSNRTARRVLRLLNIFVGLYVLDIILIELGRALYVPLAITVVQTFLANLVYAAVLVLLVVLPMEPQTGADRPVNGHAHEPAPVTFWQPVWIKVPLLLTAIAVIAPSALGFVALGRFVAHQVVLSGTVLAACGLLYLAVRSATRGRADNRDMIGIQLEKRFGLVDPGFRRQLSRLVELLATLTIAAAAMPLLMLRWGFSGADIRDWFNALVFGFEIGQFRISLARILIGLALFTGLVFSTRLLQRWLRENVLAQQRVDAGIAHSIDTAVGYAGIALALLIALSYAGLDITSLAIVAGALSVGIGFGLQSIVNNFVSGLILLVERPIKVGDWIVVGTEQGNVRRISVRSTEIETFDRASLIVPNSELVTGRVLNWTHRNPLGRAVVKVFVTPTADPELVLELLRKCAEENPDAMKTPAPNVTFDNFNGVALEFTVRVVVSDVYMGLRVGTALRVAILQKLREAGLQMANPQQDVNLKDLEWVKAAAARISSDTQRAQSPAGSNDNA